MSCCFSFSLFTILTYKSKVGNLNEEVIFVLMLEILLRRESESLLLIIRGGITFPFKHNYLTLLCQVLSIPCNQEKNIYVLREADHAVLPAFIARISSHSKWVSCDFEVLSVSVRQISPTLVTSYFSDPIWVSQGSLSVLWKIGFSAVKRMLRNSCENQKIINKMGSTARSWTNKKPNETMRLIVTTFVGIIFGFWIGVSSPTLSLTKLNLPSSLIPSMDIAYVDDHRSGITTQAMLNVFNPLNRKNSSSTRAQVLNGTSKIWVPTNPRGAERLPPKIVKAESDFYLRRLWGNPNEDLTSKQKYLVVFTVGYNQKSNIDAAVKKFSENFTIVLFHYDGRTTEWDEFEWSKQAIHVSVRKQTKWWYAKRFLHPDIVAPYDYIFIWDEDLGVDHFNAEEYIKLVRKHGLEISQPGLEPNRGLTWQMTKRRGEREVHKETEEKPGWCSDPHLPPCAAFVEIMAPVFSRDAWRCVWHMIQNDLVHGWGLDFALRKCVEPAHEKIGVVDSQWIVHQTVPSLGNQGEAHNGKAPWQGVRERCRKEWTMFQGRMANAEKSYFDALGIDPTNSTAH